MEFIALPVILMCAVIVSLLILTLKSLIQIYRFKDVPGPRPRLALLGNALLFYRPEIPFSLLLNVVLGEISENFRKDGLFLAIFGFKPLLFLVKAEYAAEFLKDNNLVSKAEEYDLFKIWLGDGLITANGNKWKNKRRLLNPTFHSKILDDYIPSINEECLKLVSKLKMASSEPYIDIRPLMSDVALNIVAMTSMGISLDGGSEESREYRNCIQRVPTILISRIYNPLNWFDFIFYRRETGKQLLRDVNTMKRFIQNVINERRKDFKPGLNFSESKRIVFLDLLLTLQSEDNSISDNELNDDVQTFMFAGHDTSSICLMWTLILLGNYPESRRKISEEINAIFGDDRQRQVNKDDIAHMHYTECVIKESLRMYPPVPVIGRVTHTQVTIGGHTFPKGSSVGLMIQEIHRDERSFPDPYDFIPERFENQAKSITGFSPFAIGPRNCIGQRFAMIEMKIILAHIFRNFTFEALDKATDIRYSIDSVMKPFSPMRVSFKCL